MAGERKIPEAWITDKNPNTKSVPNSNTVDRGATTACNACGGVVAWGVKACPHCGKRKPAPIPPTKVTTKHLIITAVAFIAVVGAISNGNQGGSGGISKEFQDRAGALINLNGYLCAEVVAASKPTTDSFRIECRVHNGGSEMKSYLVLPNGKAQPL